MGPTIPLRWDWPLPVDAFVYPEDVAALFASVPVATKVWLINEPVKIAYVDGKLILEVHPPVDGEGQVAQIDPDVMSQKLRGALGQDTGAIHWEFARKALEARRVCQPSLA